MPVVTFLNQKGGVGKTSTCHHLGGALALMGRRVLLIDNDPQSSLTQGFLGPTGARQIDPAETVVAVYRGDGAFAEQLVAPTGIEGLDIVPGHRALNGWNLPFPENQPHQNQVCLAEFVEPLRESYDWILIDCPPNLLLCSWAALAACDGLVVPLQPEDYGAQGVVDVQDSVEAVKGSVNPGMVLLGYLVTMASKRRSIHKLYEDTLRELYGRSVFKSVIPYAADYPEAIAARRPVGHYKPKSAAAGAVRELAAELEARAASSLVSPCTSATNPEAA